MGERNIGKDGDGETEREREKRKQEKVVIRKGRGGER